MNVRILSFALWPLAVATVLAFAPAEASAAVTGACCTNFQCVETDASTCVLQFDGVPQSPGTTCEMGLCQPPPTTTTLPVLGACCQSGDCFLTTADFCAIEMQGSYVGDGTNCDSPGICQVPPTTTTMPATGACCFSGSCVETFENFCTGEYQGSYSGDGTSCETTDICVNCGNSCVDFGESCDDGDTQTGDGCDGACQQEACFDCSTVPTTTQLPSQVIGGFCSGPSICTPVDSPECNPPTGACCQGGECFVAVGDYCTIELQGNYLGDGTNCDSPGVCLPPPTTTTLPATGACCTGGSCVETFENYCTGEYQGSYSGDGTSCETADICVNCGDGCVDFGESCDDGDTQTGDGCDAGCKEEACFECSTVTDTTMPPSVVRGGFCSGPSICTEITGPGCTNCGDGQLEEGEDCDDSNTANGDCCSSNCTFEDAGSSCADSDFCDGVETCDGEGACLAAEAGPSCSELTTPCATGYCDSELNACASETASKEGDSCVQEAECTIPGSGTCQDGECLGVGTTLSASCRWIIVGATPGGTVKVRTGEFSTVDANTCGDVGRSGGITSGSFVVSSDTGEGIRFDASAKIDGDIVTGGSSLGVNLYAKIPGTELESLAGGMTAAKVPSGVADTTGNHALVEVCDTDQASLPDASNALNALLATDDKGLYRLRINGSDTFDVSGGPNLSVIDFGTLRLGRGSSLTLKGGPNDVLVLRVNTGRLNISTGATVVLDGLKPENVLFYSKSPSCRLSTRVTGAGTVFCPLAGKFRIGVGTKWAGTFLGGTREIRARYRAELTHVPFTGL